MRSSIAVWETHPYNPWRKLGAHGDKDTAIDAESSSEPKFHLIGMDQRFANRSTGTVRKGDGWHTFLSDQLALLDHLKVSKCHILGSCIGPSYAFQLMHSAPERFGRCVMLQPIGLTRHTTEPGPVWEGLNSHASWSWVGDWAQERVKNDAILDADVGNEDPLGILRELHHNMFGPPRDFVFSITRQEAAKIQNPFLISMGKDVNHPSETSREIFRIAPNTELVEEWRDAGSDKMGEAESKIQGFLREGGNFALDSLS